MYDVIIELGQDSNKKRGGGRARIKATACAPVFPTKDSTFCTFRKAWPGRLKCPTRGYRRCGWQENPARGYNRRASQLLARDYTHVRCVESGLGGSGAWREATDSASGLRARLKATAGGRGFPARCYIRNRAYILPWAGGAPGERLHTLRVP